MAEPEDEDSWLYGSSDDKAKGEDVKPAKIAVKQEKDAEAPIVDVVFHSGASNSADNTKTAEESLKQTETKTEPPAVNGDSAEGKSEGTTNESSAKEKSTEEPMEQGASGEQEPEASGESEKASSEKKTLKDGEKEAEDSDDSDDDVQVTIGAITSGAAPGTEGGAGGQLGGGGRTFYRTPVQVINTPKSTAATKGLDMLAPGSINGQAVIDFNIDLIEDKPWRKPGADISDYFNYGFNEVSWKLYCEKQKRLRSGGGMDVNYVAPAQSTSSTPNGKTSTPAQTAMASILGSYEKYHATATPSAPQQQQQTKTPVRVNVPPPCTKQFTKTVQSISTLGFSRRSTLLLETSPVASASPGAVQQQPVQSMTPGPPPQAQTPATSPLFSIPPPVNGPPALPLQFDPTKPPPSLPIGIPPPGYPPPGSQGLLPPGIHPPGTEYSIQLPPSNPPQFIPPSSFMVPPQQQAPPAQSSQQFGGAFSREEEEAAANQLAQMERERRGRSEDERDRYPTSDDDRATTDRYPPPADHRSGGRDRGGDRGRDYDRDRYERSRRGLDYRDRDDYREADRARDRESRTREGRDYDRGSDRRGSDRDRDRERSRRRDESPPRESGSSTRERHKGTRRKYDGDGDGERKHKKAKKHKSSRGEKPPGGASGDESANNSQNIDHDNIVVKRERDT